MPSGDPTEQEVREQLAKILASEAFTSGSDRPGKILTFLVHKTLAGRRDELTEYAIGVEVLNRQKTFDPKVDRIAGVELGRLRDRLTEYDRHESATDPIVISVPRGAPLPVFAYRAEPAHPLPPHPSRVHRRHLLWGSIGLLFLLAGAVIWRQNHKDNLKQDVGRPPIATGEIRPLTTSLGMEAQPAFSPDGSSIVYSWSGPNTSAINYDIYLVNSLGGSPKRLTFGPAVDHSPAWSRDGQWIAFCRGDFGKPGEVIVMPATFGGPERVVTTMKATTPIAWTVDSKHIIVPDRAWTDSNAPFALFSVDLSTGVRTALTHPHSGYYGDLYPSVSPKGDTVAFSRFSAHLVGDIYIQSINTDGNQKGSEQPTAITALRQFLVTPTWASNDDVVFASGPSDNRRLMTVKARAPHEPVALGLDHNGGDPSIDRIHSRLAFSTMTLDTNIWALTSPSASPQLISGLASRGQDRNPQISPDGKAVVFESDRLGDMQIWRCNIDGSSCRSLAAFSKSRSTNPRWSPDGTHVVFDSNESGNWTLYVVSERGGSPIRLLTGSDNDENPSFSADGKWVYFDSKRSGIQNIWKCNLSSRVVEQVTWDGGEIPSESPDGKNVYFQKSDTSLWKRAIASQREDKVLESVFSRSWQKLLMTESISYQGSLRLTSRPC